VDILPHFQKLEISKAQHLCLPIYPPGVHLRLTETLHVLHLKCVSVQWMDGQIFPALHECSILFPHHAVAIQSVNMPSCTQLNYDSNDLGPITYFHLTPLVKLRVKCDQWSPRRGNLQLVALGPIVSAAAQSLTSLYLQVQCTEQLLICMLRLVPVIEELWLGLASPCALSSTFFQIFGASVSTVKLITGPSSQATTSLCRRLKRFHLHYKRWLRSLERTALVSVFGCIIASHQLEDESDFSLFLWNVNKPAERLKWRLGNICIGIPSPQGIVPYQQLYKIVILFHHYLRNHNIFMFHLAVQTTFPLNL
jgi:hypothetical protein